ncbi:fumarate hydratase, partial [Bordetella bronchiseptica]
MTVGVGIGGSVDKVTAITKNANRRANRPHP